MANINLVHYFKRRIVKKEHKPNACNNFVFVFFFVFVIALYIIIVVSVLEFHFVDGNMLNGGKECH